MRRGADTFLAIALLGGLATAVQDTPGVRFAMVFAPPAALLVEVDTANASSILGGGA